MFGKTTADGSELIFNFHGLGAPPPAVSDVERPYWLAAESFDAILGLIRTHDKREEVRITFDDGNSSDLATALPILLSRNFRATFFITTDSIDKPDFISSAGIAELHQAGMGIGSHGLTHENWTTHNERLATDISHSLSILSKIVREPVREVAIPFGSYNLRVLRILRQVEVTRVYTSDNGFARAGDWLAARNTIRTDTPLEKIVALMRDRSSPAQDFLASARRLTSRLSGLTSFMLQRTGS